MKQHGRIALLSALALTAGSSSALAQFSSDPAALSAVADETGDQTQSKTRMMPDGSFYVSWFDNRSGGYDVYLQKYNAAGVEQWAHNGVLVSDRAVSSTQDYDMRVDSAGNAVLVYGQDANTIQLTKVDPTGTTVWSTVVATGTITQGRNTPRFAILSDGTYIVGWSETPVNPSYFMLQKVDAAGNVSGAARQMIEATTATPPAPTNRPYTLCELQPSDNGSFIALWMRASGTGFTASRYLRAQKFDANLAQVWTSTSATEHGVVIYQPSPGSPFPNTAGGTGNTYNATSGGSIQIAYFPTFITDGAGGAIFSWYENSPRRNAFVQQVSSAGVRRWETEYGLPVTGDEPTQGKLSASVAFNQSTGDIFCSFERVTSPTQNGWGVGVQKIDAAGNLAWGSAGTTLAALDATQEAFTTTVLGPNGGCYVIGFEGFGSGIGQSGNVKAALVDASGNPVFTPTFTEACTDLASKGRLWAAATPDGGAVFTFNNGATGGTNVLLGNILPDGTIGPAPSVCPADVGIQGGGPGSDGMLDNNDFIAFINYFFALDPIADMGIQGGGAGSDSMWDNNDFIAFINFFFDGCN